MPSFNFLSTFLLFLAATAPLVLAQEESSKLYFEGTVMDSTGKLLENAQVQFWQTDDKGHYNHPGSDRGDVEDDFQYFGTDTTNAEGQFSFITYRPGIYPGRPAHIHFKVFIEGQDILTSQFYFADESPSQDSRLLLNLVDEGDNALSASQTIVVDNGAGGSLPLTPSQTAGPFYPVVDFFDYNNDLTTVSIESDGTVTPDNNEEPSPLGDEETLPGGEESESSSVSEPALESSSDPAATTTDESSTSGGNLQKATPLIMASLVLLGNLVL